MFQSGAIVRLGNCKRKQENRLRFESLEHRNLLTGDGLQAGDLDPTFGNEGQVFADFSSIMGGMSNDQLFATAIQPWDQKIVAVGFAFNFATRAVDGAIARFNPDGSLDQSFGTGGMATSGIAPNEFAQGRDKFFDVAVQPDGKIVVGGEIDGQLLVGRFNSNGSLDTSFSGDGFVTRAAGLGTGVNALGIQSDGKIVFGGWRWRSAVVPHKEYAIGRLHSDGRIDEDFGVPSTCIEIEDEDYCWIREDGFLLTNDLSPVSEEITDLAIKPGGGFVAVGLSRALGDKTLGYSVFHFGGTDQIRSFYTLNTAQFVYSESQAVTTQPNGNVISAGFRRSELNNTILHELVTVRQDSQLITASSFNEFPVQPGVVGIHAQPDGKLVVASKFRTLRLTSDNMIDPSFGENGFVTYPPSNVVVFATDSELQEDGSILVAGNRGFVNVTGEDFWLSRYVSEDEIVQTPPVADAGGPYTTLADGSSPLDASGSSDEQQSTDSLIFAWDFDGDQIFGEVGANAAHGDETGIAPIFSAPLLAAGTVVPIELRVTDDSGDTTSASTTVTIGSKPIDTSLWKLDDEFGINGKITTDLRLSQDSASAVALQDDGKLVVAGSSDGDLAIIRYLTNGLLDASFGNGGVVSTDVSGFNDGVSSVVIQSDGKIAVAGVAQSNDFIVARYNDDGTIDDGSQNDATPGDAFGLGGWTVASLGASAQAYDLKQQPDGKLIAVGEANVGIGNTAFGIARFGVDGAPDVDFGQQGVVTVDLTPGSDRARAVLIQADGKLLVTGYASPSDFGTVRLNVDGSLDDGLVDDSTPEDEFGIAGVVISDFGGDVFEQAKAAALLSDGRILVVGRSDQSRHRCRSLSRQHSTHCKRRWSLFRRRQWHRSAQRIAFK